VLYTVRPSSECVPPKQIINLPFLYATSLDDTLLATSLSAALARYPFFAGRVRTSPAGDYEVALTNQGASFSVAFSPCRLGDLIPAGAALADGGAAGNAAAAAGGSLLCPVDLSPLYPRAPRLLLGYLDKDIPLVHAQVSALARRLGLPAVQCCCRGRSWATQRGTPALQGWGATNSGNRTESAGVAPQVTHLEGGASCLAVAIPHLLGDLDTCKALVSAWAAAYSACAAGAAPNTAPAAVLLGHEVLDPYAAAALTPGYASPTFERRSWAFIPKLIGGAVWHVACAGGVDSIAYHVPAARLAELKAQAAPERPAAPPPRSSSATRPAEWISTNDALVARLWQVLASLPPKRAAAARFYLSLNMRTRLAPPLPAETLGNCAWSVPLGDGSEAFPPPGGDGKGPTLRALASKVRAAIHGVDLALISRDLRWLEEQRGQGRAVPTVIRGAANLLPAGGSVVLSNWGWDAGYSSAAFGGVAPAWHQPFRSAGPNAVFILPAPPALEGGGALAFITLHRPLVQELKRSCPAL